MDILLFILVISVLSGIALIILGLLITIKKKYNLINGVDFSSLTEPEKFGDFVGNSITLSGLLMVVFGYIVYQQIMGLIAYLVLTMMASIIPLPAFYFAKSKYSGPGDV